MKKFSNSIIIYFLAIGWLIFPSLQASAEEPATASALPFHDVSSAYTFYDEIIYLSTNQLISGFPDGTFRPDHIVTRAQAAIMIGKALGLNGEPRDTRFPDVTANVTGSGYIASAVERGIISGFPDGKYHPYEAVTRGQMAIFLDRAFSLEDGSAHSFTDVSSHMAAYQAIMNVAANGIASGYADGTYRPYQPVNRGQFSAFMARTLNPSFREIKAPPPKLDITGIVDGLVTEESNHSFHVSTEAKANVTVTLNGETIAGNNNTYDITFSKVGKT